MPNHLPHRREILKVAGVGAVALAAQPALTLSAASAASNQDVADIDEVGVPADGRAIESDSRMSPRLWSDPATWNGQVPGPNDVAVVTGHVVLDQDATVAGCTIGQGAKLEFKAGRSATLKTKGNIVVRGSLRMRPSAHDKVHRIEFVNVDEDRYQGGGMEILSSDVGLWVKGSGVLDCLGKYKRPWTRATSSLASGATVVQVGDASGWKPGDEVTITPTTRPTPDNGNFHQDIACALTYDDAKIVAVNGNRVTLDRPLQHSHPMISFTAWDGSSQRLGAEVLNLTRNVVLAGRASGRAHVIFVQAGRQDIRNIHIDRMGPQQTVSGNKIEGVQGRYPMHFHHCGNGGRGTLVSGVVVTRSGHRAFVPHESHGITMRNCVAHDVKNSAFWWDQKEPRKPAPETHDTLWHECVASKVTVEDNNAHRARLAGFVLGEGNDDSNICRKCVAVGVTRERVSMNNSMPSGFHWPERTKAVWQFRHCVAHNIGGSGIFNWQNSETLNVLSDFTGYNCASAGIEHGAYSNNWRFARCNLIANRIAGINSWAVSRVTNSTPDGARLVFRDIAVDGKGLTRWGFANPSDQRNQSHLDAPTILERYSVKGCTAGIYERTSPGAIAIVVRDCQLQGKSFLFSSGAAKKSVFRVFNYNGTGEDFALRRRGTASGTVVPQWNAVKRSI